VRLRCLIILQEPLDVVELLLRTQHVAEAAAQLLDDAACALDVDLARHLHRVVVAVFAPAQRTAKRIGVLLRARLAEPAAAVVGPQEKLLCAPCLFERANRLMDHPLGLADLLPRTFNLFGKPCWFDLFRSEKHEERHL
jgi:hypothetical protein